VPAFHSSNTWEPPAPPPQSHICTYNKHTCLQAKVAGKASDFRIADYALDHLGDQPLLMLPTHGGKAANAQRRLYKSLSTGLPDDLKQKLVSLLAAEFSKKVGACLLMADGCWVVVSGGSVWIRGRHCCCYWWNNG
jgi:hypothetical protein